MSKQETHELSVASRHSIGKESDALKEDASAPSYDADTDLERNAPPRHGWSAYREMIREPMAEFFGVLVMILFGDGVVCQVILSADPRVSSFQRGNYLSINFAWAVGAALGVQVSGGISGGHLNPAITLALATFRGFPWKKVPAYVFAQVMGALVAAALVYANYFHAIDIVEGPGVRTLATAGLFSTYALDYMTNVSAFFSEFLATAILMIVVVAFNDSRNMPPPAGMAPLVIFFVILGIGAALGMETGYAMNPARDFGPRALSAMVGYGREVFTFRNQYWLWCPILAPICGAQIGALCYDLFLYTGADNVLFRKKRA